MLGELDVAAAILLISEMVAGKLFAEGNVKIAFLRLAGVYMVEACWLNRFWRPWVEASEGKVGFLLWLLVASCGNLFGYYC